LLLEQAAKDKVVAINSADVIIRFILIFPHILIKLFYSNNARYKPNSNTTT